MDSEIQFNVDTDRALKFLFRRKITILVIVIFIILSYSNYALYSIHSSMDPDSKLEAKLKIIEKEVESARRSIARQKRKITVLQIALFGKDVQEGNKLVSIYK